MQAATASLPSQLLSLQATGQLEGYTQELPGQLRQLRGEAHPSACQAPLWVLRHGDTVLCARLSLSAQPVMCCDLAVHRVLTSVRGCPCAGLHRGEHGLPDKDGGKRRSRTRDIPA